MIPVQVGEQTAAPEELVGRQALAEVAQAGAHVEQQRLLSGRVDRDARRITAISLDVIALARRRAADAMERDVYHWVLTKTGTLRAVHHQEKSWQRDVRRSGLRFVRG